MAGKVDLQAGEKVLEVGSGMGKGALYMAQVETNVWQRIMFTCA